MENEPDDFGLVIESDEDISEWFVEGFPPKLVEFEGYFRSEEFVANALGLRAALKKLEE